MAGNRTNLAETVNGTSRTNQWSYDPLYRLTNEVLIAASGGTISYKYDGVGNRTNRTSTVSGIASQTLAYNSNDQLSSDVYDSNGNTRTNGSNAFFYDPENRLTNAVVGGTSITIVYDGDGNRVRKIVGTTTNTYLVDSRNPSGFAQVLEEKSNGTLTRVYCYGLDLISQRDVSSGAVYYFGYDGNGNTRFLTATNATVANVFAYDAFGTLLVSNAAPQTDYLFVGEQSDGNLGLYYLRARYLNSGTGRFWSRDTLAGKQDDPMSLHRYTYAHNNPVDNTDPSGHEIVVTLAVLNISGMLAAIGQPTTTRAGAALAGGRVAKSRPLTQGEITMTQLIFGGKIDYSKPKVYNRPYVAQSLFTAVTPNGNIYVRGDGTAAGGLYRADYSLDPDIEIRAVFIHEMTHVWQHQVGMAVTLRAILDRNYFYDFATFGTKDFKKYGIEEQAQIVEDFYLLLNGGQIKRNGSVVSSHPPLQSYQVITGVYFP